MVEKDSTQQVLREYGFRWMGTWPHISLGISAHVWPLKFAHLSLHNPLGVLIIGYRGEDTDG
jgi:hypothetical protein